MRDARVLILPSSEGMEIDVAKGHGIRESNIWICDRNAAIVATLKRRYPHVHTLGVEVLKAFERCEDRGITFHFMNLDLCGTLPMVEERAVHAWRVMEPGSLLAVTWQKGRDRDVSLLSKAGLSRLRQLSDLLSWTAALCLNKRLSAWGCADLLRSEQYTLSVVPMEWACWRFRQFIIPVDQGYIDGLRGCWSELRRLRILNRLICEDEATVPA
jgi:hypothetical protein